jgi:hypothetical protein
LSRNDVEAEAMLCDASARRLKSGSQASSKSEAEASNDLPTKPENIHLPFAPRGLQGEHQDSKSMLL